MLLSDAALVDTQRAGAHVICGWPSLYLQECVAGTWMGGALGLVILGFSYIWSGMSAQVGLVVAISLPVRSAFFLSPPPAPPLSAPPQCSVSCGDVLNALLASYLIPNRLLSHVFAFLPADRQLLGKPVGGAVPAAVCPDGIESRCHFSPADDDLCRFHWIAHLLPGCQGCNGHLRLRSLPESCKLRTRQKKGDAQAGCADQGTLRWKLDRLCYKSIISRKQRMPSHSACGYRLAPRPAPWALASAGCRSVLC